MELFFLMLRKLLRLSKILLMNLMKFKYNLEFEKEVDFDCFFMIFKWENCIYLFKRVIKNLLKDCYFRIDLN